MTPAKRIEVTDELFGKCRELLQSKGAAYSGTDDTLANFKRNAERLGLTPYQVWLVYFAKHIDAISNAVKANPKLPSEKTEGMDGRIIDSINYLLLLHCLLSEEKPNE